MSVINASDIKIKGYSPSKAAFAKFLVRQLALRDLQNAPDDKLPKALLDLKRKRTSFFSDRLYDNPEDEVKKEKLKIGIVGAGIAGLYTALVLDFLEIKYEILEANPDRIGGRLYTHYFGEEKDGTHQYYDIGAMRFPESPIMARTFDLFKRTNLELGEYIMSCPNQPMRYNDITKVLPEKDKWNDDPFKVSTKNNGPVPPSTVRNGDEIMHDAYFPYRRKIKRALNAYVKHEKQTPKEQRDEKWRAEEERLLEDLEEAWNYLMDHDKFSLRAYLSFIEGHDDESIHWLETLNAGTGWFDMAFSENVMESLAFEYDDNDDITDSLEPSKTSDKVNWYYIQNGTYKLTEKVLAKLKTRPEKGKFVTKMALAEQISTQQHTEPKKPKDYRVEVTVRGEEKPRVYDTVMCSTTFAAMQKMDLTGLQLPYAMKIAIRSLRYDASTKVAIQFKEPWWIESEAVKKAGGLTNIVGGLGKTDMPLRCCVYPSYNIHDKDDPTRPNKTAVLLCSYSWSSDSERIASMINPVSTGSKPKDKDTTEVDQEVQLKETMIENLARLHSTTEEGYQAMKKIIADAYITHHAYDWSKDPYTCGGAFALFSPSQFKSMYPNIVRPAADSRLHVIGEAASAHHAWIVGALDSAVRGIYLMLERFNLKDLQEKLKAEFGEVGELDDLTADLQVALGRLMPADMATPALVLT